MLPRYDSQANERLRAKSMDQERALSKEKVRLLPRFQSDHPRKIYDENQSADTAISERDDRLNKAEIKFLERNYDRSGRKCWPKVNTKIGKFDLEYTYEVVGNTLETYIHYRKLDRCKALSNFIEYRNKIYKREKIVQYALPESKEQMKQVSSKPIKVIQIEEKDTPSPTPSPSIEPPTAPFITISSSESIISDKSPHVFPPTPIPSLQSIDTKTSENLSSLTPNSSSQSMSSKTSQKSPAPTPIPSTRTMSPKPSQKLSPPTPTPSSRSMSSKPSQGLLSPRPMSPEPSQKLLSPKPTPSSRSMTSKPSQKLSSSTPTPSSRSMSPKPSQKLSSPIPSPRSMSPKPSEKLSPPTPAPSSRSMSLKPSQKLSPSNTKSAVIPIPSRDLLKNPPKKTNSNIKRTPSSTSKGRS